MMKNLSPIYQLATENSARGRAFRNMRIAETEISCEGSRKISEAIRDGTLPVAEIVYCADKPGEIDPTLCVITKEAFLKWVKQGGVKDYGRAIAEALGESPNIH